MFGTSGIRGIYGHDITIGLASKVASIFASGRLVAGRDIRESGPALFGAVCRGAHSAGADVVDLGIVPTPTAALATKKHSCRGIMITASHNPPEYNGLKLIEGGKEIGKPLEREVTARYGKAADVKGGVHGRTIRDAAIIEDHKGLVAGVVDCKAIAARKPKVVVDCNGAACAITPQLLTDLGCRVVSVNASESCFNRPSEPSAGNLAYLSSFVREIGADFALAHDGDGDRCMVLDELGEALALDTQLAIMIEHELGRKSRGGAKVVSTVEASLTIRDVVEKSGGEILITPVGSTYVGDALEESGALFGGEPCGEYIYKAGVHVPDAVMAAAMFAEIFCAGGPFSKLKTRYPQHFMAREKFRAGDKHAAMRKVIDAVSALGIAGKTRTDDGIRVDEEDGWFLIRASGTEPVVRLTMEYKARARRDERHAALKRIISLALA
ncbi:MAG: hypothetical protein AB1529_03230 [Candidatus Micrarchaeota archaeon]